MTHTVTGFGVVNKAEIDVFLDPSCFFDDSTDVSNLISGSSVPLVFDLWFLWYIAEFLIPGKPLVMVVQRWKYEERMKAGETNL